MYKVNKRTKNETSKPMFSDFTQPVGMQYHSVAYFREIGLLVLSLLWLAAQVLKQSKQCPSQYCHNIGIKSTFKQ